METIAQKNLFAAWTSNVQALPSAHYLVSEHLGQVLIANAAGHLGLLCAAGFILSRALEVDKARTAERERNDAEEELGLQVGHHHGHFGLDLRPQVHMLHYSLEARDHI